jgi:hypothetical protein
VGYVVGSSAKIADMDHYDLHWPEDGEDAYLEAQAETTSGPKQQ